MLREVCATELSNGVLMPVLGLGTANLKDSPETEKLLVEIFNSGYALLDTADYYNTQELIGRALEKWNPNDRITQKSINYCPKGFNIYSIKDFEENFSSPFPVSTGVNRNKKIFITGKIWPKDFGSEEKMMESYDRFVKQVKKIPDLLLLHWPGPHADMGFTIDEQKDPANLETRLKVWQFLEKLYTRRKVRAIGVANFMWPHLHHLLEDVKSREGIKPMVNQFEISPSVHVDSVLLDVCRTNGIAVTGYSTLGASSQSILNNKYLQEVAQKAGDLEVGQLVLRWALQNKYCMIPRTSNLKHAQKNISVFDFDLNDDIIYAVDCCPADLRVCPDPHNIV